MKLSAAHDSSGSEHPDVRGQIDEEEVRMPSSTPPRAVQVTPLQQVFMNHEAPPSIAIDIQSWVRFGSGQLAISLERWTMPTLPAISRKLEMGGLWSVISAVVVACITSAPAQAQSERAAHQAQWERGQFWTPIPQFRGSKLHAE
jgi:hypothetical protein